MVRDERRRVAGARVLPRDRSFERPFVHQPCERVETRLDSPQGSQARESRRMDLIFMGTPAFAVPTLERIIEAGHRVTAVFTQPDRPKGRGGNVAASPVKEAALRLALPVHQPERVRQPEVVEQLRQMNPEAMVVVGY